MPKAERRVADARLDVGYLAVALGGYQARYVRMLLRPGAERDD